MKFKLAILTGLLTISCTRQQYNGRPAMLGETPHQVSIQEIIPDLSAPKHRCAGSAIDKSWILTTGFCVLEMKQNSSRLNDFQVVAGKLSMSSTDASLQIRAIAFVHTYSEKYPPVNSTLISVYDIGLIKSAKPFHLNKWVQTIALANKHEKLGSAAEVSGWGVLRNRDLSEFGYQNMLQIQTLMILDQETCMNSVNQLMAVHIDSASSPKDYLICAGPKFTRYPICMGDTGSPLVKLKRLLSKSKIIGILSYVVRILGGNGEGPTVYTKVSKFVPWIKFIMSKY